MPRGSLERDSGFLRRLVSDPPAGVRSLTASGGGFDGRDVLDARSFARAVRARWDVENRLRLSVLDVIFHDDLARLRTGYGPETMAAVKHMALNLLSRTAKTDSLETRRNRTGWDDDLQAVITRTA